MVKGEGWRFFAGTVLGTRRHYAHLRFHLGFSLSRNVLPANFEGAIVRSQPQDVRLGLSDRRHRFDRVLPSASSWDRSSAAGSASSRASLLAISAVWWMPFYPVWSLVYIGIGVLVVYGLGAYGSRESVERSAAAGAV